MPYIYARTHRVQFMKPWEHEPKSIAHGILDDETYDWACLVDGVARSGGHAVLASEGVLRESNRVARDGMDLQICHTGTAGLAGLMAMKAAGVQSLKGDIGVLFTGADREAG